MNWEAFGAIAEGLGAGGVILTLMYLATQIRQNTKALKVSSFQATTQSLISQNDLIAGNGELAAILEREWSGQGDSLDPVERLRADCAIVSNLRTLEDQFYLRDEGLLDSRSWDRADVVLDRLIQNDALRNFWVKGEFGFDERFRMHVNDKIEKRHRAGT